MGKALGTAWLGGWTMAGVDAIGAAFGAIVGIIEAVLERIPGDWTEEIGCIPEVGIWGLVLEEIPGDWTDEVGDKPGVDAG